MIWASTYLLVIGFTISFIGSIPPGSLNITAIQIGMNKRYRNLLYFVLGAAFVEFFYAGAAIKFQQFLVDNLALQGSLQFITGTALMVLGVINIIPKKKPSERKDLKFVSKPFVKGFLISLFNPLAIPFWVMTTAYFEGNGVINLGSNLAIAIYCVGISLGTIALLYLVGKMAGHFNIQKQQRLLAEKIPGSILILLGLYNYVF